MKLIVGLGNPGKDYSATRHNVGFLLIDSYLTDASWKETKDYLLAEKIINGEKVLFLKPLTYMNLSGNAVLKVVNFYKINPEDILVIHDDLDLNINSYKLKFASSSGGHNGIKSIIDNLGTNKFARLKIGIGSNKLYDTKDYVLSKLSKDELDTLKSGKYNEIIDSFILYGIEKTMNKYNTDGVL